MGLVTYLEGVVPQSHLQYFSDNKMAVFTILQCLLERALNF